MIDNMSDKMKVDLPDVHEEFYRGIAGKIGQQRTQVWFSNTRASLNGETKLYVPNSFIKSQIEKNYSSDISDVAVRAGASSGRVEYIVAKELNDKEKDTRIRFGSFCEDWVAEVEKNSGALYRKDNGRNEVFRKLAKNSQYPVANPHMIVHDGNRKAIQSMNMLSGNIAADVDIGVPQVIWGLNAAGKTSALAYLINDLTSKKVPVGYVDVAALSEHLRVNNGKDPK